MSWNQQNPTLYSRYQNLAKFTYEVEVRGLGGANVTPFINDVTEVYGRCTATIPRRKGSVIFHFDDSRRAYTAKTFINSLTYCGMQLTAIFREKLSALHITQIKHANSGSAYTHQFVQLGVTPKVEPSLEIEDIMA